MTDNEQEEPDGQAAVQQLYAFVAGEMKAGTDKSAIAQKVQEMGLERSDAERIVDEMYTQIAKAVAAEKLEAGKLVPALAGAVLAAVLGGAVWAGIVIATEYELGIVAWVIGGLSGFAVVMLSGGRKGVPLQIMAVVASVLGILTGKYLTFYYFLRQSVAEEQGAEAAASVPLVSPEMLAYFASVITDLVSPYDALWVILAVITAWRIPRSSGIQVPAHYQGPIK